MEEGIAPGNEEPDSINGQQPSADAAQYHPYTMPEQAHPCYYCGSQAIEGAGLCQRCNDWTRDRAQKKAKLSFRLGLAALLTLVACIVILCIVFVFRLDITLGKEIALFMLPASIALGVISIISARDVKRLVVYFPVSGENEQKGMLRATRAGISMGTVSIVIIGILMLIGLLTTALFFVALFTTP